MDFLPNWGDEMISVNYPRTMPGCKPLYLAGIGESEKIISNLIKRSRTNEVHHGTHQGGKAMLSMLDIGSFRASSTITPLP
jgi:hypothetical protein